MKIIFNYKIDDWKGQIYQELKKSFEIILPEYFLPDTTASQSGDYPPFNFEGLRQTVIKNPDATFIFSFYGDIRQIIKWDQLHLNIPIVDFRENALNRPYTALRSAFVNLWYDERFAQPLLDRYNRNNLVFAGMAANPDIFHPLHVEKKYDISFIGQPYGERGFYIKKLYNFARENAINAYFPRAHGAKFILTYERINEIYNQSKINIAFAPKEQPGRIINLRSYEICMSGNFQLVQYTPCLEEFFDFGTEIVGWSTTRELFKKIRYYLQNPDERERIAKNGFERALHNHTWTHRFKRIIEFLDDKKKQNLSYTIEKYSFRLPTEVVMDLMEGQTLPLQITLNLKNLGYNPKKNLKKKTSIRIHDDLNTFAFKPDLKNFQFIELYNKIMMVLYIFPREHKIVAQDWETLVRIRSLIQNFDLTTPIVALVTNLDYCICFNFQTNHWLKEIPTKSKLISKISRLNWLVITLLNLGIILLKKLKTPVKPILIRIRNKIRNVLRYKDWNKLNLLKLDWTSIWILAFGI